MQHQNFIAYFEARYPLNVREGARVSKLLGILEEVKLKNHFKMTHLGPKGNINKVSPAVLPRMGRKRGGVVRRNPDVRSLIQEQQRQLITEWRDKRNNDPYRCYRHFLTLPFGVETMKSLVQDINIMVFIHIGECFRSAFSFVTTV